MKEYEMVPRDVQTVLQQMVEDWHSEFETIGVNVQGVFVFDGSKNEPVLTSGGRWVSALVEKVPPKWRALGHADLVCLIDRVIWDSSKEATRLASLDYALQHLTVEEGKDGPKFIKRGYDVHVGEFFATASRHKRESPGVADFRVQVLESEHGQLILPGFKLSPAPKRKVLPIDDAIALEASKKKLHKARDALTKAGFDKVTVRKGGDVSGGR